MTKGSLIFIPSILIILALSIGDKINQDRKIDKLTQTVDSLKTINYELGKVAGMTANMILVNRHMETGQRFSAEEVLNLADSLSKVKNDNN